MAGVAIAQSSEDTEFGGRLGRQSGSEVAGSAYRKWNQAAIEPVLDLDKVLVAVADSDTELDSYTQVAATVESGTGLDSCTRAVAADNSDTDLDCKGMQVVAIVAVRVEALEANSLLEFVVALEAGSGQTVGNPSDLGHSMMVVVAQKACIAGERWAGRRWTGV